MDRWYEASYNGELADGKKLKLHIYTIEKNINENYTVERADLIMSITKTKGDYFNGYGSPCYISVNGNGTSKNVAWDARSAGDKTLIDSWDTKIAHDVDGSKKINISASHQTGTNLGNANITGEYVCDSIPRQATVVTGKDFTDEENPAMTFTNTGNYTINARIEFAQTRNK